MSFAIAAYEGVVFHRRQRPKRHELTYRVFSLALDLDRLQEGASAARGFSLNRFNLMSFHEGDHGDGREQGLRQWVDGVLEGTGIEATRVVLIAYPRILGFTFNPLAVYFCYGADGSVVAVIHEVTNTFHERIAYVLPATPGATGTLRFNCDKAMYVSPFTPDEGHYRFTLTPPAEEVGIIIDQSDSAGALLHAAFTGAHRDIAGGGAIRLFFKYPLMTLKVVAGIHWEAFLLWAKGVPWFAHNRRPPLTLIYGKRTGLS